MKFNRDSNIEAQVSTICMIEKICKTSGLRNLEQNKVMKQYNINVSAMQEEANFALPHSWKQVTVKHGNYTYEPSSLQLLG